MKKRYYVILSLVLLVSTAIWSSLSNKESIKTPLSVLPAVENKNEIVIGINLELSGKFAPSANSSLKGSQLAVAELNQQGGLLGKPLRLAIGDNRSDETMASQVYGTLVRQSQACAVIGPMYSTIAIASGPLADELKVPFIATSATNPRVTVDDNGRTRPYAFRVCFIDSFQGTVMADFALKNLKAYKAAVYVDDSAYYSQGLASFFTQAYLRQGGKIIYKAGYTPEVSDFSNALLPLLAAQPEVIFIPGYYSEVAKIIQAARELGFKGPIIGGDAWEVELLLPLLPPAMLDNTFYSAHLSLDDATPEMQAFIQRYLAFAGESPSQSSILSYDATMLLADAIRRAASSESVKIRDALEQTRDFSGISGLISLNERHNAAKSAVVMEIKNGRSIFCARISPQK